MGWQDRDYANAGYGAGPGRMVFGGFRWPKVTPMVKKLLIANAVVFALYNVLKIRAVGQWGAFVFEPAVLGVQIWRFVTYQYLHGSVWHLFMNMLGLYFLGSIMEQRWGERKFFVLYTLFGIVGAIIYALTMVAETTSVPMIGASGSVLGLVGACAVAAPHVMVILFVFPVPIRTAAIIFGAIYLLKVMGAEQSRTADACHLGGLAMGALWVWLEGKGLIRWSGRIGGTVGPSGRKWVNIKIREGAWQKKQQRRETQQVQIDRILQKVHEKGLASLNRKERKLLQQASKDQR